MRYVEGRAWIVGCPRCAVPIIEAHENGLKFRLSRRPVPFEDAKVMGKYFRIIINVWEGAEQLWAVGWHYTSKKPSRGRLYVSHSCGAWK